MPRGKRHQSGKVEAQKAQRRKDFEEKNNTNGGNSSAPAQVSVTADDISLISETTTPARSPAVSEPCRDAKQSGAADLSIKKVQCKKDYEEKNINSGGKSSKSTQVPATADDISVASVNTTPPLSPAISETSCDANQSNAAHLSLTPDDSKTAAPSLLPAVAEQLDDESLTDSMDCGLDPDDDETPTPPQRQTQCDEAFPGFGRSAMPGAFPFTFESARKLPADYTTELAGESWLTRVIEFLAYPVKVVVGKKRKAAEMDEYEEAATIPRPAAQTMSGNPGVLPTAKVSPRKSPKPFYYSHGKPDPRYKANPIGPAFAFPDHKAERAQRRYDADRARLGEMEESRLHSLHLREVRHLQACHKEYHVKSYDPTMTANKYESFKRELQSVRFKEEELRYLFECVQNQAPIQIPLTQATYQRGIELFGNEALMEVWPVLYDFISRWVTEIHGLEQHLTMQAAEQTRQAMESAATTFASLADNPTHPSAESAIMPATQARQAAENTLTTPAAHPARARHYVPRAAILASASAAVQDPEAAEDHIPSDDDEDDQASEGEDAAGFADEYEPETDDPVAQLATVLKDARAVAVDSAPATAFQNARATAVVNAQAAGVANPPASAVQHDSAAENEGQADDEEDTANNDDEALADAETGNPLPQPPAVFPQNQAAENEDEADVADEPDDDGDDGEEAEEVTETPEELLKQALDEERQCIQKKGTDDVGYGMQLTNREFTMDSMIAIEDDDGSGQLKNYLDAVDPVGKNGETRRQGHARRG